MAVSVALLKLPVLLLPRCPDQRAAETRPRARRHHLRYELCCGCFWQIVLGLGVVGVVGVVVPCAPARLPFAFCSRSSRTHSHSHSHTLTLTLTHTHTRTHTRSRSLVFGVVVGGRYFLSRLPNLERANTFWAEI